MNKPITVAREDFATALINLVNDSGLPAFVMSDILKNAVKELERLEGEQYQLDKQAWEESQTLEDAEE